MNDSSNVVLFAQFALLAVLFFGSTRAALYFQRRGFRMSLALLAGSMLTMLVSIGTYLVVYHDNSLGGMISLAVFAVATGFLMESRAKPKLAIVRVLDQSGSMTSDGERAQLRAALRTPD